MDLKNKNISSLHCDQMYSSNVLTYSQMLHHLHVVRSMPERKQKIQAIKTNCRIFFVEVVSSICFGQLHPPEDLLVNKLLDTVLEELKEDQMGDEMQRDIVCASTRDLTPLKDDLKSTDDTPIIRSFLLQLLLQHRYEVSSIEICIYNISIYYYVYCMLKYRYC